MSGEIEAQLFELIGPVLAPLSNAERPAIVALAERIAAGRYRAWAEQLAGSDAAERLLACADREEDIATRVEALLPNAAELQARATEAHEDLPARYAGLFENFTLPEQFARQARAERAGVATWTALAEDAPPAWAKTFRACAELEETSAKVLDGLIAEGVGA